MTDYPFIVNEPEDLAYELSSILLDGSCSNCAEDIGHCWMGLRTDGNDEFTFFPYWVHESMHLCPKCHAVETEEIPEYEILPPEDDQPLCGGFIIIHSRATDQVHFGPFATYRDALVWARKVRRRGLAGYIVPLTSPDSDIRNIWHDVILPGQLVQKTVVDSNY